MKCMIVFAATFVALAGFSALPMDARAEKNASDCIAAELDKKHYYENTCIVVHVRRGNPGLLGGTERVSDKSCIPAPPGYSISGTAQVTKKGCFGNRCKHDDVEYIEANGRVTQVCLRVEAWTEDKPFGGGAYGSYELCADVGRPPSHAEIVHIARQCEEKVGRCS